MPCLLVQVSTKRFMIALFCFLLCAYAGAQVYPSASTVVRYSQVATDPTGGFDDARLEGTAKVANGSYRTRASVQMIAKGPDKSRLWVNRNGESFVETRSIEAGLPVGFKQIEGAELQELPLHNCLTPAAWFFPISILQDASAATSKQFIGAELQDGHPVIRIRYFNTAAHATERAAEQVRILSSVDLYIDSTTYLLTKATFVTHPEDDANSSLNVEIRFSDYRIVNGIQVPFHVERFLRKQLELDFIADAVSVNLGIDEDTFALR